MKYNYPILGMPGWKDEIPYDIMKDTDPKDNNFETDGWIF